MKHIASFCFLLLTLTLTAHAQKVIRLYPNAPAGSENWKQQEKEFCSQVWQTQVVTNVVNPTLTMYAPDCIALYSKWLAAKKPVEMHLYAKGGHGFGVRKQNLPSDQWIESFGEWLNVQGFLKK